MSGSPRLSGWCITGHCLPGPTTSGCPGTFPRSEPCEHSCHRGDVPERALRQLAADQGRMAAKGHEFDQPDDQPDGSS